MKKNPINFLKLLKLSIDIIAFTNTDKFHNSSCPEYLLAVFIQKELKKL